MATFSRLEKISEQLSEKEVENVCDGVHELSLCDIQIATEGYSMSENQNTEETPASKQLMEIPTMRNKTGAIHKMSTILVPTTA